MEMTKTTKKSLIESIKSLLNLNTEDLRIIGMMTKSQLTIYLTNLQKQKI